jgi:hypothetical protein
MMSKYFTIHEGDVGSEAYDDNYVCDLATQLAEAKAEIDELTKEIEALQAIAQAAKAGHIVLCDLLDAFWDLSPLQYAATRGMNQMGDAEGERIKDRARKTRDALRITLEKYYATDTD